MSAPLVTALSFGSYEISKKFLGVNKGQKMTFGKGTILDPRKIFIFHRFNGRWLGWLPLCRNKYSY